ncbi:UNVERIFIED_CONTAM: hypothetical protein NY603_22005, partial [Bacteroidetes bacterium 56_B9]
MICVELLISFSSTYTDLCPFATDVEVERGISTYLQARHQRLHSLHCTSATALAAVQCFRHRPIPSP